MEEHMLEERYYSLEEIEEIAISDKKEAQRLKRGWMMFVIGLPILVVAAATFVAFGIWRYLA